ncbi:hypothetical protein V6N13_072888 [Hibiscus sabdariffa]
MEHSVRRVGKAKPIPSSSDSLPPNAALRFQPKRLLFPFRSQILRFLVPFTFLSPANNSTARSSNSDAPRNPLFSLLSSQWTANSIPSMRETGVSVNSVTMLGLVPVLSEPGYISLGSSFHFCCVKLGLNLDFSVDNCLLTMYVKCGAIEFARNLFDEMPQKGLITWNAMISGYSRLMFWNSTRKWKLLGAIIGGYGMHGYGEIAVELLNEMIKSGIQHDGPEHYSCVVDLLGQDGRINEALEFIKSMQVKPDGAV